MEREGRNKGSNCSCTKIAASLINRLTLFHADAAKKEGDFPVERVFNRENVFALKGVAPCVILVYVQESERLII